MPLEGNFPVEGQEQKNWATIPEGVYQAVVKDITEKDSKKYQSEEMEVQYFFRFVLLDGEPQYQGQIVSAFTSRKWFTGSKKYQPSKLVNIVKAVYGYAYPKIDVLKLEAEDMSPQVVNDLIGKQLMIVVKQNADKTGNKVTDFMVIKKELDVPKDFGVVTVNEKMLDTPKPGTKKAETTEVEDVSDQVDDAADKDPNGDPPF